MVGYAPIYTNNKIIAKPPVKASKESLGSALDSFYNDIARIEKTETERTGQLQDIAATITEQVSISTEEVKPEMEMENVPSDITMKERKKKKVALLLIPPHRIYFFRYYFPGIKVVKSIYRKSEFSHSDSLCYVKLNIFSNFCK